MNRLLSALVVLALASAPALAGPNAGGVIVVHNTNTFFSDDGGPPPSPVPACANVVNEIPMGPAPDDMSARLIWKVFAAFPPGSSPRLKTCGWGISYPGAGEGAVVIEINGAQNAAVFYITSAGWPASGTEVGMSFTDGARTATVNELWWFSGYGYPGIAGEPQMFSIVEASAPGNRVFGDDAYPTNEDPIMGYGSLGFGQPGFTPCPPDFTGACCFADGTCQMLSTHDCASAAGTFIGGECLANLCPNTIPGACCFPNGYCVELIPADCEQAGGSLVGGACTPELCPAPEGACCFTNGTCQTVQPLPCAAQGGLYLGNDTPCEPNPCPPYGACCYPSGLCMVSTSDHCVANGGSFVGGACTPNLCPITTTGACCIPGGTCELVTAADCATAGGWFVGGACTPELCTSPGACCFANSTCSLQIVDDCVAAGGWFIGLMSCEPNPCPIGGLGACCNPGTGECTITAQDACAYDWHGPDTPCEVTTCPVPVPTERRSWGQIKNSYR